MKKLAIIIAIILGMGMTLSAQIDENMYETRGGLFGMGQSIFTNTDEEMLLPYGYAEEEAYVPETYYGIDNFGDAGFFGMGNTLGGNRNGEGSLMGLPTTHGSNSDADAPLGSGIAVLVGLGAAYMVGKKRKE